MDLKTSGSLYLYDNQNGLIYQGSRSNEWANLEDISQYLIDAVVAVEDKNFYKHNGFNFFRIAKAMFENLKSGETCRLTHISLKFFIKPAFKL